MSSGETVAPVSGTERLMTLAMFAIQIAISNAWLRCFRFGPLEWLWRSLTYGQFQPLRRRPRRFNS